MKNVATSPTETEQTIGKERLYSPDGKEYREFTTSDGVTHRMYISDSVSRIDDESYEMYRIRRQIMNKLAKKKRRGVQVWPPVGFKNIPYTHELDSKIGELYASIIRQKQETDGN